jgi:SAM-dependent methyltransferase
MSIKTMLKPVAQLGLDALQSVLVANNRVIIPSYIGTDARSYEDNRYKTCVNIGSGPDWKLPGWTALDMPSDWYHKADSSEFKSFDLTKDPLPFGDRSIDLAYCSHVIEHVEFAHVRRLLEEIRRTIKPTGGFRVICPDADLLVRMYRANAWEFWSHRYEWATSAQSTQHDLRKWELGDFLARELATPRCRFYRNAVEDCIKPWVLSTDDTTLLHQLTDGLTFRPNYSMDHITWWSFDRLARLCDEVGLTAERSAFGQSRFSPFQNVGKFDFRHYWLAMYVDISLK